MLTNFSLRFVSFVSQKLILRLRHGGEVLCGKHVTPPDRSLHKSWGCNVVHLTNVITRQESTTGVGHPS